jgi:tryptophan synthase alpha subunit
VGSALVEIIENSLRKKKSNHNIAQKVGSMVKSLKKKLS